MQQRNMSKTRGSNSKNQNYSWLGAPFVDSSIGSAASPFLPIFMNKQMHLSKSQMHLSKSQQIIQTKQVQKKGTEVVEQIKCSKQSCVTDYHIADSASHEAA